MYALVRLLYELGARIQDVVDTSFGSVIKAKKAAYGRIVILAAKKSDARQVPVTEDTVNAVQEYQKSIKAKDEDIMFPGGDGKDPANKWVKKL